MIGGSTIELKFFIGWRLASFQIQDRPNIFLIISNPSQNNQRP